MKNSMNISKQITTCYEYVDLAERSALDGRFTESNRYWSNATNLAMSLLKNNEHGTFLDEEYHFLTQVAKHIKDEDNETEYY
jgi:hypothetical protein